ncbi:MAG: anhydro-N-acetylmuramic acid kinase [Nitrospirota bacterium]|nr:anhydro-N-acetylmuramic acid kinase [Nitrospirota bacterium]
MTLQIDLGSLANMKVIGLMSGTSADGIDAALVDVRGGNKHLQVKLLAFALYPYPSPLQKTLIDLASGSSFSIAQFCRLNFSLGERFADAVMTLSHQAKISLSEIDLIGSHGQTIQHLPKATGRKEMTGSTLQIGEPSVIAERTGITTIADFRPGDMAAGGEGAPLAPYFHYHLLRHKKKSRAIINLGGISNITYLKAGASIDETVAFDMGPANMLLDGLVSVLSQGKKTFDLNGAMAKKGQVSEKLLSELMRHPFIKKTPPKSTGREVFGGKMVEKIIEEGRVLGLSKNDLLATTTAYTVFSVEKNIQAFILKKGRLDEVIVGGGGVKNPVLMQGLTDALHPIPVLSFEDVGHDSRAIEAMTFAVLAYQSLHQRPSNIPSVTGAGHTVVLGKIIPGFKSR